MIDPNVKAMKRLIEEGVLKHVVLGRLSSGEILDDYRGSCSYCSKEVCYTGSYPADGRVVCPACRAQGHIERCSCCGIYSKDVRSTGTLSASWRCPTCL